GTPGGDSEASEKKEKLRNILQKLTSEKEEAEERVQIVEELKKQVQGKASGKTKQVAAMIKGIRKRLKAPKKRVLSEISSNDVSVSEDLKTVSGSGIKQNRPETPERFQFPQILCSRSFSSGRHYWEVEVSESGWWGVGMAYPSIERRGEHSGIGKNKKSWVLERKWINNLYYVRHDSKSIRLPHSSSFCRLGIFLDYEAGRLSFYELCDLIRHLHTFTAAFNEPLLGVIFHWLPGTVYITH
uniref:B30.2/SPRY domain-containing protein n=1 Tax=Leptobrachium leishanense TaxID=445787 RepID=A0A8C5PZQ4_9ANUR